MVRDRQRHGVVETLEIIVEDLSLVLCLPSGFSMMTGIARNLGVEGRCVLLLTLRTVCKLQHIVLSSEFASGRYIAFLGERLAGGPARRERAPVLKVLAGSNTHLWVSSPWRDLDASIEFDNFSL